MRPAVNSAARRSTHPTTPAGPADERYFADLVFNTPVDIGITLTNVDVAYGGTARVEVVMTGFTLDDDFDPDHHAEVWLNGTFWTGSDGGPWLATFM